MQRHDTIDGNLVIGLTEHVQIKGNANDSEEVIARIDTGATKSSIDIKLATKVQLGPVIKSKMVKSANGAKLRPVVNAEITIAGKTITGEFTLADRTEMKYPVLVGANILKEGYLVNPSMK